MNRIVKTSAIFFVLALSGCDKSPDSSLAAEVQQLKQAQDTHASELQDVKARLDGVKTQLDQIQSGLGEIKALSVEIKAASSSPISAGVVADGPVPVPNVEAQHAAGALAPSVSNSSRQDEEMALASGWIVDVFPMAFLKITDQISRRYDNAEWRNFSQPGGFSRGSFISASSPINLTMHRKHVRGSEHMQYALNGFFAARSGGPHVFYVRVADGSVKHSMDVAVCNIKMSIEENIIIDDYIKTEQGKEFVVSGGVTLSDGLYKTAMYLTCNYVGAERKTSVPQLGVLDSTSFSFAVRRPNEQNPVDFATNDIVHMVPKN